MLKLVLGEAIRLEYQNLLFRSVFLSVVKIWKWVLEMRPIFARILKLVLGEGIRLESRNLLFCGLDMEVVWKCALYLKENFIIILKLVLGEPVRQESGNFSCSHLMLSEVKI